MRTLVSSILCFLFATQIVAQTAVSPTIINTSSTNCTGSPVTFSSQTGPSVLSYTWSISPAKGYTLGTSLNDNAISFTPSVNLTYTVTLKITDPNGIASSSVAIAVARRAKAAFNAAFDGTGFPATLLLTNYSTNNTVSYWQYNDVATTDSSTNTSRLYTAPGNYSVTLIAKGLRGCSDVSGYAFEIPKYSSLVLPNIFTPNNDDVNEVYRPIMTGISSLKARVLNRDGQLVCSWDKVNGFWDGHSTSGEDCSEGEYFIVVEATGFDGQTYKLKRVITLAR